MQQNKRQTGAAYEEQAARFLLEQGYQILERNYRCRQGEIDVIARDGSYLVFVEVKYRSSRQAGHPMEAVNRSKQRKIIRTAMYYCYQQKVADAQACRFDVVSILGDQTELVKHAFEVQRL